MTTAVLLTLIWLGCKGEIVPLCDKAVNPIIFFNGSKGKTNISSNSRGKANITLYGATLH